MRYVGTNPLISMVGPSAASWSWVLPLYTAARTQLVPRHGQERGGRGSCPGWAPRAPWPTDWGRHQYDYQGRCGARPLRHARDCPRRGERRLTTPSPAAIWGQKRTNSSSLELVSYANYFSPLRSCVPRVTCHCCQVISQCFAPVFVSIRLLITTGSVLLAALHGPTREEGAWVLGQGAACSE